MGELGCVNLHCCLSLCQGGSSSTLLRWGEARFQTAEPPLLQASLPSAMLPWHLLGIFSSHPTSWTFPGEIAASRVLTELPLHVPTQGSCLRRVSLWEDRFHASYQQRGLSPAGPEQPLPALWSFLWNVANSTSYGVSHWPAHQTSEELSQPRTCQGE